MLRPSYVAGSQNGDEAIKSMAKKGATDAAEAEKVSWWSNEPNSLDAAASRGSDSCNTAATLSNHSEAAESPDAVDCDSKVRVALVHLRPRAVPLPSLMSSNFGSDVATDAAASAVDPSWSNFHATPSVVSTVDGSSGTASMVTEKDRAAVHCWPGIGAATVSE